MASQPANATDWITLLGDKARTGGQGPCSVHAPARVRWQLRVARSIRSAPVLRKSTLYVTSVAGTLHAIDATRGRPKWVFHAADKIHSTPAISGDLVLFGCDDGKLYAVNCHSGKKVWETPTRAEVWTSPSIRNGIAYFGSADQHV